MATRRLVVNYWAKPIPIRRFDWEATFDNYESGDYIGYGATRDEAIQDLANQLMEDMVTWPSGT